MAIKVTGNIVIDDSQAISNITSITANGNISTTGNIVGVFANGTSNISIPAADGNINLTAGGGATELVVTTTGINVAGTLNATGNANVLNLGTAQVLATANITAPQLISNVTTGTAPLVVTSTTVVANLNADTLDGYDSATAATANTVVVRNADGNITGNFFIGNGSQLTGISAGFPLANGTSNINAPAVNGNINISVGGTANVLITTSTGVNVTGTLNATGNANVNNLGTAQVLATANVTAPQLISNVAIGTAPLVVTSTTKVTNLNADTLDGYDTATAATANTVVVRDTNGNITGNFFIGNGSQLTGISAGFPLANGTSNINAPAVNGNINISVGGTANVLVTTSTGVNVAGTFNTGTGNANVGNLGTTTAVITTANITTINSTLLQQGTANITLVNNGNIRFNPGGSADEVVFTSTGANINGYLTVTGNITGGIISNSTNVFNTTGSNYAIGFRQMPQNSQGGSYTLQLDDESKSIYFTGTTTATATIPTNASQAFPIGSVVALINNNSGTLSVNSSATLQLANGNTANRSVATKGMATCIKVASDTWYIIGTGVT
jgi:hypothetical protein